MLRANGMLQRACALSPAGHCTAKGTETSVVSHDIATSPPRPAGFLAIANVSCSTGVSSARFVISRLPRSADAL